MSKIYGLDTTKPYNEIMVRDAMERCFIEAHCDALAFDEEEEKLLNKKELEKIKKLGAHCLIKNFFQEVHGDYNTPTKTSLQLVCDKLKNFSQSFRKQELIEKHYKEITEIIKNLK